MFVVMDDDDDGFDLLRGYGVYVHLCTVQIGARLGTWYVPAQHSPSASMKLDEP